jgi:DNA repair photolyase
MSSAAGVANAPAAELAEVFLSVTTLDKDLARTMEPRASAPRRRSRSTPAA